MVRRRTLLVVLASVALGQHAREPGVRHLQYKTPVNCTDEVLAWIENSYQERASEARPRARCRGDISEHLPLFRALCQDVSVARCAEVGVRNAYATWAFLSAAAHRLSRGEAPLRSQQYPIDTVLMKPPDANGTRPTPVRRSRHPRLPPYTDGNGRLVVGERDWRLVPDQRWHAAKERN